MPPDDMAPVIPWDDFMSYVFDWRQNQHVGMVGPTEQGKTNLGYHILMLRKYIAYLAIKPYDETLEKFASAGGYERIETWPPIKKRLIRPNREVTAEEMPRRLVWPDATQLNSETQQREVFQSALDDIYASGGWATVLDDYWYLAHILKFELHAKKMLMNARSNDIPLLLAMQRPAGNRMVEVFDQSTHLFFFRDNDELNLKRIGGVGYLASEPIRMFVANLERFQTLYINTRDGRMYRTTAPELTFGGKKRG
jgi:hypothetical protein